jgi:lysozyme
MQAKLTKIPGEYVNVRAFPSVQSADLGNLYLGSIVEIVQELLDWVQIKYNALSGWVSLQGGAVQFTKIELSAAEIVDVSEWNGDIDWKAVKAAKVKVAIIRSTIGVSGLDLKADKNLNGALNAGLSVSQYHLFKSDSNPLTQAQRLDAMLDSYPTWVTGAVDVESDDGGLTPDQYADRLYSFCEEFRTLRGLYPMIYTGAWFWNPQVGSKWDSVFGQMLLWTASYDGSPHHPRGWQSHFLWQYTSDGKVSGFNGRVDLNRLP